jgi:hypothetical protein
MGLWRFMDYHSPAGKNLVEDWYCGLETDAVRAEFDVTLKVLSIAPDWRGMSEFKCLGAKGLCEIRFKVANVQYRPAGFFGPGERTFSIYVGCQKKGNIYKPPNAFDLAADRKAKVLRGEGSLRERLVI